MLLHFSQVNCIRGLAISLFRGQTISGAKKQAETNQISYFRKVVIINISADCADPYLRRILLSSRLGNLGQRDSMIEVWRATSNAKIFATGALTTMTGDVFNTTSSPTEENETLTPRFSTSTVDYSEGEVYALQYRVGLGCIMCVVLLIAIVGNLLVLLAISKTRALRRLNNYLLVSLASSDFLSAVTCMPLFLTELFSDYRWILPRTLCSFYTSLQLSFVFLSVWNIAAISLERVFLFKFPLIYQRLVNEKRMLGFIVAMWTISLTYGMSQLFWFNREPHLSWSVEHPDLCRYLPSMEYAVADFIVCFMLPLVIMFCAYQEIYCIVQTQMNRITPRLSETCDVPSDISFSNQLETYIAQIYQEQHDSSYVSVSNNREIYDSETANSYNSKINDATTGLRNTTTSATQIEFLNEDRNKGNTRVTGSPESDSIPRESEMMHCDWLKRDNAVSCTRTNMDRNKRESYSTATTRSKSLSNISREYSSRHQVGTCDESASNDNKAGNTTQVNRLRSQDTGQQLDRSREDNNSINNTTTVTDSKTKRKRNTSLSNTPPPKSTEAKHFKTKKVFSQKLMFAWRNLLHVDIVAKKKQVKPRKLFSQDQTRRDLQTQLHSDPDTQSKSVHRSNVISNGSTDPDQFGPNQSLHNESEVQKSQTGWDQREIQGNDGKPCKPSAKRTRQIDRLRQQARPSCDPRQFDRPGNANDNDTSKKDEAKKEIASHEDVFLSPTQLEHCRDNSGDVRTGQQETSLSLEIPDHCSNFLAPSALPRQHRISRCFSDPKPHTDPVFDAAGIEVSISRTSSQDRLTFPLRRASSARPDLTSIPSPEISASKLRPALKSTSDYNLAFPLRRSNSAKAYVKSSPPLDPMFRLQPVLKSSSRHVSTGNIPDGHGHVVPGARKRNSVVFRLYDDEILPDDDPNTVQCIPSALRACSKNNDEESTNENEPRTEATETTLPTESRSRTEELYNPSQMHAQVWAKQHFNISQSTTSLSARSRGGSGLSSRRASSITRRLRENKAVRMTLAVIGAFVLCILPYKIVFLLRVHDIGSVSDVVWNAVSSLMFCTNALNPFIYNFYNSSFRVAIKKLLTCKRTSIGPV